MDSSFTIKPPAGARGTYAPRDPIPVREAVETDLNGAKAVTSAGNDPGKQRDPRGEQSAHDHAQHDQASRDQAAHDVVADPASREVIYRARDVRIADRGHPDHALLRQRAYRVPNADPKHAPVGDQHADIKA